VPRDSRKDRKHQRQRASNAADRGLPASALKGPVPPRASSRQVPNSNDPALSGAASSTAKKAAGFSSSLLLKILALTTLVLLGISLWRTITKSNGTDAEALQEPQSSPATVMASSISPVQSVSPSGATSP